ncbi:FMN-dependent NADH-azoreductase [Lactiplantibacillus pingfangensis]|uniref:FMN-dependent NADH-azoreductase n=1 Tax=Lactiplantibacillus pingfangensis TaxID=2559915 RepID=UPI0010F470F4|nr:NAD(P)H-dependent oxidoreductase [Lactiplantibacillus pingfangensis]
MKILVINAHPDFMNPARTINQLQSHALTTIRQLAPHATVAQVTLYDPQTDLPRVTATSLNQPETVVAQQNRLIDQWQAADLIMIMMPLHNFNVVSKLKDYIDNIFIANKTFKYTATGSIGLLDGHQKVVYVQSSGSDYEHDLRYVAADIAPYYLRTILNLMGIPKMTVIRAQGLDLTGADRPAIVAQAKQTLTAYLAANLE